MSIIDAEQLVPGYTVVRGLSAGPNGAVLLAKREAGGGEVVIKTFRPAALVDNAAERADRQRRVTAFLDVCRTQQQLAAKSKHWAPVHAFGPLSDAGGAGEADGDGAFYVTDHCPASAAWLARDVRLTSAALARVVAGVIAGVTEMRECCGRGHGNLTPANVLLTDRDLKVARVLLTDPSPEARPDAAAGPDEADDRWAVGSLIYALVTHRSVRRMMLLPETPDQDWAQLGRDAARWLAVCTKLLSRDPAARPDLSVVLRDVGVKTGGRSNVKWVVGGAVGAAAVLAAAAAAGLGGYVYAYQHACARVGTHSPPWLQSVVAEWRPGSELQAQVKADPWLADHRLPQLLDEIAPTMARRTDGPLIPSWAAFSQARHAADTADDIQKRLGDPGWPLLAAVEAARKQAQASGLVRVAAELAQLTDGLPPGGDGQAAAAKLLAFLNRAKSAVAAAQALVAEWQAFADGVQPLAQSQDPTARAMAAELLGYWAGEMTLGPSPRKLPAYVNDRCGVLVAYLQRSTPNSKDDFTTASDTLTALFDGDAAAQPRMADWRVQLRRLVALEPGDLPPQVAQLADAVRATGERLRTLPTADPGWPALSQQYAALQAQADTMCRGPWTAASVEQAHLAEQCAALQGGPIKLLDAQLRAAAEILAWLDAVAEKSQGLPQDAFGWKPALEALTKQGSTLLALPDLPARRANVEAWIAWLGGAETARAERQKLIAHNFEKFGDAVVRRWVDEVWAQMPAVDFGQRPPTAAVPGSDPVAQAWKEQASAVEARTPWVRTFGHLTERFPLEARATDLAAAVTAYDAWVGPKADPEYRKFWQNEVVGNGTLRGSSVLARDVERFAALNATAAMSREQLTAACVDPKASPAVALFARLRLEALGANAWPGTPGEFRAAVAWLSRMRATWPLKLSEADLVRPFVAELPDQWLKLAGSAATEADLAAALAMRHEFGIDGSDPATRLAPGSPLWAKLGPTTIYDLMVYFSRHPEVRADPQMFSPAMFESAILHLPYGDVSMVQLARGKVPAREIWQNPYFDDSWYRDPRAATFGPRPLLQPPPPKVQVAVADPGTSGAKGGSEGQGTGKQGSGDTGGAHGPTGPSQTVTPANNPLDNVP